LKRVVIGVGNQYRRDDAAGIQVIRDLNDASNGVELIEHDGEPAGLLDLWDDATDAYVVDAVRGSEPGRIHRVEVGSEGSITVPPDQSRDSSHALGLGDAVELGRVLDRLPRRLVLIGIEGADFEVGEGLTEEVARSVRDVTAGLARELAAEVDGDVSE
jgi:hydrogenase maturation protease